MNPQFALSRTREIRAIGAFFTQFSPFSAKVPRWFKTGRFYANLLPL